MSVLIPQSQQRLMRWKNGGGMTCEIQRFPQDSSLDSFDWRISVATVQQANEFSLFPGVDRSLAILEGKGILLDVAGELGVEQRELTPRDPVYRFDGETAIHCTLIGGGIVDFNVMTRRAAFTHTLEQLTITRPTVLSATGDTALVYVVNGNCQLANETKVHAGDAVLFRDADEERLLISDAAELMLVQLYRQPR
jgi:environmental stress-induced protein Ves